MAGPQRRWAAELLHFWFHHLTPRQRFAVNPDVDDALRRRFGREWAALQRQPAHAFLAGPRDTLAAIILFDQVPRNLYRGTARAFATDRLARQLAKTALTWQLDTGLSAEERQFFAMPLMHSESMADQLQALRYYARLGPRHGWPFARAHARMIARFGRFPHRNPALDRRSTAAEQRAVAAGNAW